MSDPAPPPDHSSDRPPLGEPEPTCDYVAEAAAARLVQVLDQYLLELKVGRAPSRADLIARYPDLASQLEACLAGLEFLHGTATGSGAPPRRLGDFQIGREVGRGGMGAVFEAQQISLGRRVALKILRFGGVSDPEAIERFRREAETVARLHHTNIVPIFAVGVENGVHYYAMQFIDGRSLAEVLTDRQTPLPATDVAEWGLQAAEALAHAHQRGVVHRDVKPSNLLLDDENRVWLSDFGLARRREDVTLSLSGALLGTPRYMSPEQAGASRERVDQRSDLFSLGATLYELLTAEPAFSGDTPHEVIRGILESDPRPPRELVASLPRDLETIVLKCLAKDPASRYQSARELADDLRAFLDGRPIRARRASLAERSIRWLRAHRRNVMLAGAAAGITLLVTLGGMLARAGWESWRKSSIQLFTVGPPVVAEFLDDRGEVLHVATLPMPTATQLPAGEYSVRAQADGMLSQTFGLRLERGQQSEYLVGVHDQQLLPTLDIELSYDIVDRGSSSAILLWTRDGAALRPVSRTQLGWATIFQPERSPALKDSPGFRWPWNDFADTYSGYGSYDYQPLLASRTVDVNGDGSLDLICGGRHQAWVMALSGKDGRMLWFAPRSKQLTTSDPEDKRRRGAVGVQGTVVGRPIIGGDYDEDQVPDVLVNLIDLPENAGSVGDRLMARRWVEALSGKSGKTVWRFDLPDELFEVAADKETPSDLRWFAGPSRGATSSGSGSMLSGRSLIRDRPTMRRTGTHVFRQTVATLDLRAGRESLRLLAGRHLISLNPRTGRPLTTPADLQIQPGGDPRWGDVDGDGDDDCIVLEATSDASTARGPSLLLHVWSAAQQKVLWSRRLAADWPARPAWTVDQPNWPLVTDLNGDKRVELVVPHGSWREAATGRSVGPGATPWGGVSVFAGDSGRELWNRKLVSIDGQLDTFLSGPDLNGDGTCELFVVTLVGTGRTLYADALSGENGETFWTQRHEIRGGTTDLILAPLEWWQSGSDGWPQLLVHAVDEQGGSRNTVMCSFSAGTGAMMHQGAGMSTVRPTDLDRDGLEELLLFQSRSTTERDTGGTIRCLRGFAGRPWKRLGDLGQLTVDLDGDGLCDFVRSWGDGTLVATSGATGCELWRCRDIDSVSELRFVPASGLHSTAHEPADGPVSGDLDQDGHADLLVWMRPSGGQRRLPRLHAISGRTGRRLWTMSEVTARAVVETLAAATADLDEDGRPEFLWLAALDHGYPDRQMVDRGAAQLWLFVASGSNGSLKWSQPLSPSYGRAAADPTRSPFHFFNVDLHLERGDLDGDGILDLLVPAIDERNGLGMMALSGADGQILWQRPRIRDHLKQESLRSWTAPTVCDFEGDQRPELVVVEPGPAQMTPDGLRQNVQIAIVDGRSGQEVRTHATNMAFVPLRYPNGRRHDAIRPVCFRAPHQQQRVAVYLLGNESRIFILASDGGVTEQIVRTGQHSPGIWACDVDGDGIDEAIFVDNSELQMASLDHLDQPQWRWPFESTNESQLLAVLPATDRQAPVIAIAKDSGDNSVCGINARDGTLQWICPGPIARDPNENSVTLPTDLQLIGHRPGETPRVYYSFGFRTECRQAAAVPNHAAPPYQSSPNSFATRGVAVAPAKLAGTPRDRRWERDLPWLVGDNLERQRGAVFRGWCLFFSLALVVVPVTYGMASIRKRRFSLGALLGLPFVVGLSLVAALTPVPADNAFRGVAARFAVAVAFAPPLFAIGLLVTWGAQAKWKQVAGWLFVVIVISASAAGFSIGVNVHRAPLLPEERFDWTGWYEILLAGAYITSWILVIAVTVTRAVQAIRTAWRRGQAT